MDNIKVVSEIPYNNYKRFKDKISHKFRIGKEFKTKTFGEFFYDIVRFAQYFEKMGIKKGTHVAFFCDNKYEWTVTDFALQILGAVSVPRGTDSTPTELTFIFDHSDSEFLVVENDKVLNNLLDYFDEKLMNRLKVIFVMKKNEEIKQKLSQPIFYYEEILNSPLEPNSEEYYLGKIARLNGEDLVTIVYTSGTTGNPKGVMLTHNNFLHNIYAITPLLKIEKPGEEKIVAILPVWHVYERTFEYCAAYGGMTIIYSSIKYFAMDLQNESPHLFASVPRIWQSVYDKIMLTIKKKPLFMRLIFFIFLKINLSYLLSLNYLKGLYLSFRKRNFFIKSILFVFHLIRMLLFFPLHLLANKMFKPIREKLGKNMRASFSGAGALPRYIDNFFNAIGIKLINAYGMTEASPGIISRRLDRNIIGATGVPFDKTEIKIVNNDGKIAKIGEKGVLYARGQQVMKGYYKNPEKTKEILDKDGWLNTGDLAVKTETGDIVIVGRAKDTIVLLGGENVEPEPIEAKLKESEYIDNAVVCGQDEKFLSAIISIDREKLEELAKKLKIEINDFINEGEYLINNSKIINFFKEEISKLITSHHGFKGHEKIKNFVILNKKFKVGEELTPTLKIKRKFIKKQYKTFIKLFHKKK